METTRAPAATTRQSHAAASAVVTRAGKDRHGENGLLIWGMIPLNTKVATTDTAGQWYLFEHHEMPRGGPPRHIHFEQDEWFYVVKGEFAFEIGDEKFRLTTGDSLLAPRKVAHAWACIGSEPGTLLTALSPAGTFETFIRETAEHATLPSPREIEAAFERHGMKVVGPPLAV